MTTVLQGHRPGQGQSKPRKWTPYLIYSTGSPQHLPQPVRGPLWSCATTSSSSSSSSSSSCTSADSGRPVRRAKGCSACAPQSGVRQPGTRRTSPALHVQRSGLLAGAGLAVWPAMGCNLKRTLAAAVICCCTALRWPAAARQPWPEQCAGSRVHTATHAASAASRVSPSRRSWLLQLPPAAWLSHSTAGELAGSVTCRSDCSAFQLSSASASMFKPPALSQLAGR